MQKRAVYAYDAFQLEDDGWLKEAIGLGSWRCQDLKFSPFGLVDGVRLNNEDFRQFRGKNNFGGDFYVFTALHAVENCSEKNYELSL